ncbi:uncharacterized protein MELLADRAFT_93076 [Melampsora larici-populina 98AG31]|uniref:Uncharacterized protein n=1 Tax=Melampsora larici-populina (strain 98AG31 / pathotype 3-4-7) TaxID=747676 RepID=F4S3V1_MELLP|nr:uncharacterized protein MELLADRAFT_93076 [Melampsora larici-populina 98AG31]EGG00679.1 hypothetical protein MELLADRAFT_93076 [Melampsora larici-populina 98AG31]
MLAPTSRGNSESVLDPDNPAVNKQIMLDWLRINHPKTPVSSKANKGEVADIVRKSQPHIFGDPNSPAGPSTQPPNQVYPSLESLRVSSPAVGQHFQMSENLLKRSASADLDVPHPNQRIANIGEIPGKRIKAATDAEFGESGESSKIKGKKSRGKKPKSTKIKTRGTLKPVGSDGVPGVPQPQPLPISPISSLSDEEERLELQGLKQTISAPLVDISGAPDSFPSPQVSIIAPGIKSRKPFVNPCTTKDFFTPNPSTSQLKINKSKDDHTTDELDLIQFSDTEIFDIGNLVIGRDIPTIGMQEHFSPSKKKTGVDVFQEEQRREQKVKSLEERLAHLETSIDILEKKASNSLFQEMQQHQSNADAIAKNTSLLEQAKEEITVLQDKVETLDTERINLQYDLDMARINIDAHHRIFRKILGSNSHIDLEEQYDSSSKESESSDQQNPVSCNNDSTVSA